MWTSEKPTEEGWYLIRIYDDELEKYIIKEIHIINNNGLKFELNGTIHCLEEVDDDIEWSCK